MRLLTCHDCLTIEQLPDPPRGVDPHNIPEGADPLFDQLLKAHRFPNGEEHRGALLSMPDADWANTEKREEILRQIHERSPKGLGEETYALRDTFHEDALKCFSQHGRPERCIDWMDESKRLGRPTKEGQAWQRENYRSPSPFLCHFCPCASVAMQRQRMARGDYDA